MKMINFANPINGRKWLKLLEPDFKFGMLFKKNIHCKKKYLGFSFKSNKFGLRGPDNTLANKVVSGTSFAMGLSVDNGKNWYEQDNMYDELFNIGMPISFNNQINLLKEYYKGSYDTLVFLYHPNIWVINNSFNKAEEKHVDIFTSMNWSTNLYYTTYLYLRWLIKERVKFFLNKKMILKINNNKYHINLLYSYFSEKNKSEINKINQDFLNLCMLFKEVIVLKVPIKEELALRHSDNKNLRLLNANYHNMWNAFINNLPTNTKIFDLKDEFTLSDYLEQDTHWNEQGNIKLHKYLYDKRIF